MLFISGLVLVLLIARIVGYGSTAERPDTTSNTMQDVQLDRALNKGANEIDVSLNSHFTPEQRAAVKLQLDAFRMENAKARMNSSASAASRRMATQPGSVRSAYA